MFYRQPCSVKISFFGNVNEKVLSNTGIKLCQLINHGVVKRVCVDGVENIIIRQICELATYQTFAQFVIRYCIKMSTFRVLVTCLQKQHALSAIAEKEDFQIVVYGTKRTVFGLQ